MNVVVLAGSVVADPVERTMPSGDAVTEFRVSVPDPGRRLLPLPVAVWHGAVPMEVLAGIAKGDEVLVHGQLVRRFYRSGAGARSLTEVVASGIKRLELQGSEAAAGAVDGRDGERGSQSRGRSTRPVRTLGQK